MFPVAGELASDGHYKYANIYILLDPVRHQPERDDNVDPLWSVAMHTHPAGNPDAC